MVGIMINFQCFDTVDWVEGHMACKRPVPLVQKGPLLKQVEKKNHKRTGEPRFTWKLVVEEENKYN